MDEICALCLTHFTKKRYNRDICMEWRIRQMIERVMAEMRKDVVRRMWMIADLQQSIPENATACMTAGVEDFKTLNLKCDGICYLGDAVEGGDEGFLREMTQMQIEQLGSLNAPVYYTIGNHDMDFLRRTGQPRQPFFDTVKNLPNWHTANSAQDTHFWVDAGPYVMFFFCAHAAADGSWHTSNGTVRGEVEKYPYYDVADSLRAEIASFDKPVFTMGHYGFPGANRGNELMGKVLPLPENVRMHFYGHAHIGDSRWAGKDLYRKIACVDNQQIPQINVASLENRRGSAVRSAIWEYYEDGTVGVYFRNHTEHTWDEIYMQRAMKAPPARIPEEN